MKSVLVFIVCSNGGSYIATSGRNSLELLGEMDERSWNSFRIVHWQLSTQCRCHAKITSFTKSEYAFLGCLLKSKFIFDSVIPGSKYRIIQFAVHSMHNMLAEVKPHQLLTTLYFVINSGGPVLFDVFLFVCVFTVNRCINEWMFTIEKMLKFAFARFEMLQFAI